ncbi:MAG TPA: indole-3-glycerol phosphate synthase TrpC [Ruminococcaceae bacterium]|nr:indole-3-glycerol phosphate synthase TrpC [Oscillospiraceae bacterium]
MGKGTILDTIMANRKKQVALLKEKTPLEKMAEQAFATHAMRQAIDFASALKEGDLSVIAEVKKASPSKGVIQPDFHPEKTALAYQKAGANAISVLTEETFFQGSAEVFQQVRTKVSLPLLRKDFIFDEWQLCEACIMGADAVLLIASLLDVFALKKLLAIAEMFGMQCLVEVRSEEQAKNALRAGARVVGVNNRDLATFKVDLSAAARFRKLIPEDVVFVSESGIVHTEDMRRMREIGADAVLIGETLMRAPNIEEKMRELRER